VSHRFVGRGAAIAALVAGLAGGAASCRSGSTCAAGPVVGQAPFAIAALTGVGLGSENGTGWPETGEAVRAVDWGEGPFHQVTLAVDLGTTCFPFETWADDPPPAGQLWPATCDAFDRNIDAYVEDDGEAQAGAANDGAANDGAVATTEDPGDAGALSPLGGSFNVVHAITPFGGPEHLEVDLTDLANARPGKHRLRIHLESYSDPAGKVTGSNAGWTVSATIAVSPGPAPRRVLAAQALVAGRVGPGDAPSTSTFEVPAGAHAGRIEYRASGHGQGPRVVGCIGPADEFCARSHLVFVDGAEVDAIDLHRDDCQSLCTLTHHSPADAGLGPPSGAFDYCAENPCGAASSVRAARANWCPGSMTAPQVWDGFAAFAVRGPHTFSTQIVDIGQDGSWLVSATYYAYVDAQPAADASVDADAD
jgi:hypothetical protein